MLGARIIGVGCASLALVSCASDDEAADSPEPYLGLQQPKRGFQLRSRGATIPPGADVEYCEVAELPGDANDTYYVKALEFANGTSSHHLIVTTSEPGSASDLALRKVEIGTRIECVSPEAAFGAAGTLTVGGAQHPYSRVDFPPGVGRVYHGGQRIVFDYHYLNTTAGPTEARSAVNFHLTDREHVEHEAVQFGFYNFTIDTQPGKAASFTAECRFRENVMVSELIRHTHAWGKDFSAWFLGGQRDGQHVWTSHDWEHDVDHRFAEPVSMKAGEGFRFECAFQNPGTRALRFGTSATDEMCVLIGLLWPADGPELSASQDCSITWVDTAGIGHSATDSGGFPKPGLAEVAVCALGMGAAGLTDPCAECRCNSCATPLLRCAGDADCGAILACIQQSGCKKDDCATACRAQIDRYSSATGLLAQLYGCVDTQCAACNP